MLSTHILRQLKGSVVCRLHHHFPSFFKQNTALPILSLMGAFPVGWSGHCRVRGWPAARAGTAEDKNPLEKHGLKSPRQVWGLRIHFYCTKKQVRTVLTPKGFHDHPVQEFWGPVPASGAFSCLTNFTARTFLPAHDSQLTVALGCNLVLALPFPFAVSVPSVFLSHN